jgi:hypothetical protein
MAEGDGAVFNNFKLRLMQGAVDMDNDDFAMILVDVTALPDIDTDKAYSDVSTGEVGGPGYTVGGENLATAAGLTLVSADDAIEFDGDNITWTGHDVETPTACILMDETPSSDPLLVCYWELTTASNGGDYTLNFNSGGILALS